MTCSDGNFSWRSNFHCETHSRLVITQHLAPDNDTQNKDSSDLQQCKFVLATKFRVITSIEEKEDVSKVLVAKPKTSSLSIPIEKSVK